MHACMPAIRIFFLSEQPKRRTKTNDHHDDEGQEVENLYQVLYNLRTKQPKETKKKNRNPRFFLDFFFFFSWLFLANDDDDNFRSNKNWPGLFTKTN